jgi:hypothetical protein
MTIIPWPPTGKRRRPKSTRKLIVDPLPPAVLGSLVADLPGPRDETDAERANRYDAQLAEVVGYQPRDTAEAMLATHCVMLRLLAEDAHRDAARLDLTPEVAKKLSRSADEFDELLVEMKKILGGKQNRPLRRADSDLFRSLGLSEFLVPDPDDAVEAEQALGAIIIPLHPAPKMLH